MLKATPPAENLLAGLPEEVLHGLFARGRTVSLAADQMLFLSGDSGDGCYRVDEGLLKVFLVAPMGSERILAVMGAGAMVGELSMIGGSPRSASVAAMRDSKLYFISRAAFDTYARERPAIYRHLTLLLARRLIDTNGALAATSFLSLRGRVARSLLSLADGFGQDVGGGRILVRQKITQSDLAAMAGIARENVSRILREWMRRSLVSRLAGYYCLENKSALQREAEI
jgi:CRP/FNR family transcriptional regulator, cyclic AMP receptor protein